MPAADARPPRCRMHAGAARVGDPEVTRDDIHGELLDGTGKFDARRAAADDDEGQLRGTLLPGRSRISACSKERSSRERMKVASSTSFMPGARKRQLSWPK